MEAAAGFVRILCPWIHFLGVVIGNTIHINFGVVPGVVRGRIPYVSVLVQFPDAFVVSRYIADFSRPHHVASADRHRIVVLIHQPTVKQSQV